MYGRRIGTRWQRAIAIGALVVALGENIRATVQAQRSKVVAVEPVRR